jgi:hypothetical protein
MAEKSAVKEDALMDAEDDDDAVPLDVVVDVVAVFDELLHATIVMTAPTIVANAADRARAIRISFSLIIK